MIQAAADGIGKWFGGLPRPTRSDWIFALRTVSAGLIALLVAYALKIGQPHWAMMTVFIVAQPVAGMVLAKGFYRLVGTLVGAVAAIVLTRLFGANPWLFVTMLSLWIGACTFVSSLLRNPEAYGAALAGYQVQTGGKTCDKATLKSASAGDIVGAEYLPLKGTMVADSYLLKGEWPEYWTFDACGEEVPVKVTFKADGWGGAFFTAAHNKGQ